MVSNTAGYGVSESDWEDHITEAIHAHIDAFALNIASGDSITESFVGNAFLAAQNVGGSSLAYWNYNDQPLCSTFEGSVNAADCADIMKQTNCFFMPDWSSLGAKMAIEQVNGDADGLLSWAAWLYGDADIDTYGDASYQHYLNGNARLPMVLHKHARLQQKLAMAQKRLVIISWNYYGEYQYIGPSYDSHNDLTAASYVEFDEGYGDSPYNYAETYDRSG
ncbi:carbohydrate-binding module family 24 protein [Penicillium verrucosum]|uniref:carbohydrate-binding module family 24 protein n=1 Tax=Penicillium verrucosum TaxID=60171 RepID=UPI0025452732|nr:carbohydrate-binding module family 24 protein [Penicillium verrucosum]KAJ5931907.1 carbohydrate-binding module family 24 protein [Penicillium verrucosum]